MNPFKQDYSGQPIFLFKSKDGTTRFIPNDLETIHEYIKSKGEFNCEEIKKSGAI